jgi:NAD-dependent dihydropyrimidine dehydrogenase PreA subunit
MERNQIPEKVMQVNQELCTGCGSCIDVCSVRAIQLVDHVAEIDDDLCIACEACLEACPNGAIISITVPVYNAPITVQPVTDSGLDLKQHPTMFPETPVTDRGLKPLAGAALTFLGSEVAPRLMDVLIKSIENKLARPTTNTILPSIPSSRANSSQSRGQRKQIRHRGGSMGNRKYNGRR